MKNHSDYNVQLVLFLTALGTVMIEKQCFRQTVSHNYKRAFRDKGGTKYFNVYCTHCGTLNFKYTLFVARTLKCKQRATASHSPPHVQCIVCDLITRNRCKIAFSTRKDHSQSQTGVLAPERHIEQNVRRNVDLDLMTRNRCEITISASTDHNQSKPRVLALKRHIEQ